MNPKKIIQATAGFQKTPRLPVAFFGNNVILRLHGLSQEKALELHPKRQAEIYVNTTRELGSDIIQLGPNGTLSIKGIGGKVRFRQKSPPDVEEPLVKSIPDVDKINLDLLKSDYYYQSAVESAKDVIRLAGKENSISTGAWGPFTLAGLLYGAENLLRDCLRNKEAVRYLLDFALELYIKNVEDVVAAGADMVSIAEPTASGDMISKKVFVELALPYLQKAYDWINAKGRIGSLHICGKTDDRLDTIADTGTRIFSMDYKVSLEKAREILGGKVVLAGNIDPVSVMQMGDPETIKKACADNITQVGGAAYIMMPGCGLPPATPVGNIRAMVETAHAFVPV